MDPSEDPTKADSTAFRDANKRKDEMVRSGVSWSGRERNCCFLNTGTLRFANVSAAAGLDHIGDGRAYALVDWDSDGDLDLWATNRNGPRVQFLRNNSNSSHHFLGLRLEGNGTTTNRDAIGARVEVELEGDSRPLLRSIRAGEGFLSQSSKTLHFGLGTHDQIKVLKVTWPGGEVQQFTGLEVDRTYSITQGNETALAWSRSGQPVALEVTENAPPAGTDLARIPLRFPILLPEIEFDDLEGKRQSIEKFRGSPTLVNLWASWCLPCLRELAEFRNHADAFEDSGLQVLALSVDGVAEDAPADKQKARSLWRSQDYPFHAGMADAELIEKLETILYFLFDHRRRWAVPSSFLLDSEGRLAAIYIGRVSAEQLLEDVTALQSDEQSWFESAFPFPGRWADSQRLPDLWPLVLTLFEKSFSDEALGLFTRLEKLQAPNENYRVALSQVVNRLLFENDLDGATQRLGQIVEMDPENIKYRVQLANILAQLDRTDEAVMHRREILRLRPDNVEALLGLGTLLRTTGNVGESIIHLQKAISLDTDNADAHYNLALASHSLGKLDLAIAAYESTLKSAETAESRYHYSYGKLLLQQGKRKLAVKQFYEAYKLDSDSLVVQNALAWAIATSESFSQKGIDLALDVAQIAADKTEYKNPQVLDTLAATYAADRNFKQAILTAEKAIQLARESEKTELVKEIQSRLNLYRKSMPFRNSNTKHE